MFLPKGCQQKHSIISGIYSQDGDCDYLKSMERDKSTKSYFSVYLSFIVGVGVITARLTEIEYVSLSIRVGFRFRVDISRFPESKDRKIYLGKVG